MRPAPVDDVAVRRAVEGDRGVRLNREERRAAIRALRDQGYGAPFIAGRLGITERTVQRDYDALRDQDPALSLSGAADASA